MEAAEPTPPNAPDPATRVRPVIPNQRAVERSIRRRLERVLLDPESARYEFFPFWTEPDAQKPIYFMCGTVNAKNRFGGYTGRSAFLAYISRTDPTAVDALMFEWEGALGLVMGEICEDRRPDRGRNSAPARKATHQFDGWHDGTPWRGPRRSSARHF
jgi:hypothetical protein